MRVCKYLPEKLYGFVSDDDGHEIFFHLGAFHPGDSTYDTPPPPILGEPVEVEIDENSQDGKAPRAKRVIRLTQPEKIKGVVESFDPARGYGFITGEDGVSYHLHMSEVLDGKLPLHQRKVTFYKGTRMGKPRACFVKIH